MSYSADKTGLQRSLIAVVVAALALAAVAGADRRQRDDVVVLRGAVTDLAGRAVAGATVELRGRHLGFSLRDFKIKPRGLRSVRSETDDTGAFEIHWTWHPYYNRFELVAGVPVGPPVEGQPLDELARLDVTSLMKQDDPPMATLQLEDTQPVDEMREFLAIVDSDDERRVYQKHGKPDKVRHTVLPTYDETSWWYFEQGKVYRFRNGRTESVEGFEPIAPSVG